jgi:hypothetical protein
MRPMSNAGTIAAEEGTRQENPDRASSGDGGFVLSSQQESLLDWAEAARRQSFPRRPFNVTASFLIEGPLDVDALRRACAQTVWHQPALRTSYRLRDRWEVVVPEVSPPLRMVTSDMRHLPAGQRMAHVSAQLAADSETVFPLDSPVRLRVALYQTADDAHVLSIAMDHLVSDGQSLDILIGELDRRYRALTGGAAQQPEPPTMAFFDFARRQRARTSGPARAAEVEFWRNSLGPDGPADELTLPFERDSGGVPVATRITSRALSREFLHDLDVAGRAARATRFRMVLAALQVVLRRYAGGQAVSVRSPDANRDDHGTRAVIGWFAHLVVYRVDLSGDPTLDEVLDRVRLNFQGVQAHKNLTHYDLMKALRPDRYGKPRAGTWVVLNHVIKPSLELAGLRCSQMGTQVEAVPPRTLDFELAERGGDAELSVSFDENRYPQQEVATMLRRVCAVLEQLASDRSPRLSALPW